MDRNGVYAWRRPILVGGALLAFVATGAGGAAFGAIATDDAHGHGVWRLAPIQRMIRSALDGVGATTVQEDRIHDIVATGSMNVINGPDDRRAMRLKMLDLLRAPTIDRSAVEKLRQDQVARYDARSKAMIGMVLDGADQLTPEQRAKLGERAVAMMMRRGGQDNGGPDGGSMGRGWRDRNGERPMPAEPGRSSPDDPE